MQSPLLLEIKGNSLDDGPGIRSVIFFKGCPLECVWCHNPESKKTKVEISWDSKTCISCKSCIPLCPQNALSPGNPDFIDREKCNSCFVCVDECSTTALERVGESFSVEDIVKKILPYKTFFDSSDGGVTLSGGEPTLYMEFCSCLLQEFQKNKIHTLLETCGYFNTDKFKELILPYVNTIYFDLKIMDKEQHKKYCGVYNRSILNNLTELASLQNELNFELLVRIPLIPGIIALEENLKAMANFLLRNKINKISLLSYNPLWIEKNNKIASKKNSLRPELKQWMSMEDELDYKQIFLSKGIEVSQD